ncbi:hypothetical protein [Streptomyces albogriseolus]|uniref:hypothetical protein n=1 Tax=Streptomyces albogriseolus TaxID=1887 RepID=UPI0034606942
MTWQQRMSTSVLLGVVALLVIAAVAVQGGGSGTAGLDESAYKAGYDAFGGAYLPGSDEDREAVEARCELLWAEVPGADQFEKESWVTGCADYVEDMDSRF